MPAPLVPARSRGAVLVAVLLCALAAVSFGGALHGRTNTAFDEWAFRATRSHAGWPHPDGYLHFAQPMLSFAVIVLVATLAAITRRWALLALATVGPGLAVVITEYVLKPLVHRVMTYPALDPSALQVASSWAYPSGHETGVASAGALVVIAAGQLSLPRLARRGLTVLIVAWIAAAAFALVHNQWHYATDTLGAIGVSVAVVTGSALLIDAAGRRVRPPRERQLT